MNPAGIITTVAGTGTNGFSGDNGPATSANLGLTLSVVLPINIAVDLAGNIFIPDAANHRVRKVAAGTGVITTVAGTGVAGATGDGGPAVSASLNQPLGVAVDAAGNLYIADQQNSRIRRVGTNGIISTVAGRATRGFFGDVGQSSQMVRQHDPNHFSVCTSTDSTAGRSRTMAVQVSPASEDP